MMRSLQGRWPLVLGLAATGFVASCEEEDPVVPSPPFDEVFQLEEVIELGDDPVDPVATVGIFLERRDGGFLMGDGLRPRVRTYSETGELQAAFGRFGDGPWEFRRIIGLAETPAGGVVVSAGDARLTYLHADLAEDSLFTLDGHVFGRLVAFQDDVLFTGYTPENTAELQSLGVARQQVGIFHRLADGQVLWSSWTTPARDKPYWGAMGSLATAAAGDSLFIMASLLYPATILNGAGDSIGTIGQPSSSFRRIPEIPAGYFAFREGETPDPNRMRDLLASYDVALRIDVLADDYLVFTVGRPDETSLPPGLRFFHTHVEAYNRHTGAKLFEDVALPEGSKVVGGGRYLYVLLIPDIPPWRVAKYRLVPN
ncbi:MAG: hypothetical protein F4205_05880 [Gemmatimonadetes bacterium]|nr:hypothetical protein [Gemmatimonadota bacterium]MXX71060.1 hypothetical protein [Gemmatimonadota bacterium]MYG35006.1 hypothetical protein [Gemmatimonadota bacterium]